MTKREAVEMFRAEIMPHVRASDRPAVREAWNNFTDALAKDRLITMRQYETWTHPGRSGRDRTRRSVSQADRLAGLQWNVRDAKEALHNAVAMGDWLGVIKYASQLQKLERDLVTSSSPGLRRAWREKRQRSLTAGEMDALEAQRRRGRSGVP